MESNKPVLTVTQFNKKVKSYLEMNGEFREFFIEGEMSNITYYKSGHLYFSLKDANSQIKCACFNYRMKKVPTDLKEGDSVKMLCDVSFYEVRGDFQILVRFIEKKDAIGEMYRRLIAVKEKMAKEGYFHESHKKKLPKYPRNIGVVTAISGAAIHDIIKTTRKRDDTVNLYIYPAKVQGEGAIQEIISGIRRLNQIPEIDLIIAGRGGGSAEDLWAFNEEAVAKAFYASDKSIISAVGHEVDYMLTDMVADMRAATPTQAIELSVPERAQTMEEYRSCQKLINTIFAKYIANKKSDLIHIRENYNIKNFRNILNNYREKIIKTEQELNSSIVLCINNKKQKCQETIEKLKLLNPLNVMSRGFSVVMRDKNTVIKSVGEISTKDKISVRFIDGVATAQVLSISHDKK